MRPRRHVVTRYLLPLVLIAGFAALVTWAAWDWIFPPRPVTVVPVFSTMAEVRQEGTPLFNAAGWIEPRPTPVRVAALAPGVVESLLVVEDQAVEAGEPVAQLVNDDAELKYERAVADRKLREAELAEARAALKAAETRLRQPVHLEAALGEADAALARIETELQNLPFAIRRAEADLQAAREDYEGKTAASEVVAKIKIAIARSKFEAAQATTEELTDRKMALAKEQAALAQRRNALKTQLELLTDESKAKEEAEAQVQAAEARVEQTRVAVAEAQLRLDRMTIPAPLTGRVYQLIAHPGTRVGGGAMPSTGHDGSTVVTMYRPDRLQVRVDVRFEDLPRVQLQQPVEINNPALPAPLRGHVLFISSEADIQKNTLQVKVAIPDPPAVFKPEMLVDVTFLAPPQAADTSDASPELTLYVPRQLIQQTGDQAFVWIADQSDSVARRRGVRTGRPAGNGLIEVTEGLDAASRLIAGNREGLEEGDRIVVTGEDETPEYEGGPGGRPSSSSRLPQEENR